MFVHKYFAERVVIVDIFHLLDIYYDVQFVLSCVETKKFEAFESARDLFFQHKWIEWVMCSIIFFVLHFFCRCQNVAFESLTSLNFAICSNSCGQKLFNQWPMLLISVCFLLFASSCECRSNGVSNVACQNMTPVHGSSEPQLSISRIQVVPHAFRVKRGQQIKVTLRNVSPEFIFRGFLIQARATQTNEIVGSFIASGAVKVMACGNSLSTASHSSPSAKSTELLHWRAPGNFVGSVRFQWEDLWAT